MKNLYNIAGVMVFAILLSACGNKKSGTTATSADTDKTESENLVEITQEQYNAIGIQLGSAEIKPVSGLLKVTGYIDVPPQNLLSVTTQMGGIIVSTPLLQGSSVTKGQVIAVLENQDYVQLQQDYLESRSVLELNDAEYQRQETLASQNVNSRKTLQQAKNQYQIAQARESALRQRLQLININAATLTASNIRSRINIYAPVTGYVTKVNVNSGKFVNPNDVMFEIVNGTELHVELNVFEKDVALLKPGQQVRFRLTGDSTERKAVIELVGREIKPDKTITVHALATGSNNTFVPGTYLTAQIAIGQSDALTLPENAVVDYSGKKYIFVSAAAPGGNGAEGNKLVTAHAATYYYDMQEVTTGNDDSGLIQVELPPNKELKGKIVVNGAYDLLSKLKNSEEE
ncbi:efflux RND transporter periplasmic adaptor subunit [Chitinophaga sancti]|uniref:Efflux RND transporter periplasmic adaptor subunit n=1 Tax=Chitinophaga sancti TaxID=1004 RepID=A0A1K1SY70_9BACT|nr:efflux RND transporter periplasmic adaptor subunit [Chitinophaga sancti]WQD63145.1 efflux RND transporter periplasmic adaptor subunit [Chitinophaga sancti]WQG91230.1 efflux RND transporter periplasmic adaptor subunit [Chitinophaga sancti]SFW88797.1 membrane fusion protein, cobalt-zinc-cadmium efflux system [Chitinophaga sancti]